MVKKYCIFTISLRFINAGRRPLKTIVLIIYSVLVYFKRFITFNLDGLFLSGVAAGFTRQSRLVR